MQREPVEPRAQRLVVGERLWFEAPEAAHLLGPGWWRLAKDRRSGEVPFGVALPVRLALVLKGREPSAPAEVPLHAPDQALQHPRASDDGFVVQSSVPPAVRQALHWAVVGSPRRLERPACQRLFSEFSDASGQTLQKNLDAQGETGAACLRRILFADDDGRRTEAEPPASQASPDPAPRGKSGGFRADRLSRKHLRAWNKIVDIVMAEDRAGQPLHPTLRRLWDGVDTSGHLVYIEMPDRKRSYIAGRFAITRVDPEGKAHEGRVIMNLRVIDKLSTGPAAARAGGFIPFDGLGKNQRYAELLGHELAHAVWTLAAPERARLVMPLQSETEHVMRRVLGTTHPSGDELRERVSELERLSRMLEEPAEAAEVAVWKELRAGQRRR